MRPLFHSLLFTVLLAPAMIVAAEFRALAWEESIEGVTFSAEPRGAELRITPNAFTAWQSLKPTKEPIEFKRIPKRVVTPSGTPAGPTSEPEILARVEWPEGLQSALLLFVPAPVGAPTRYVVVVIPERAAEASPPAARVFNYSAVTVAVQVGESPGIQLAPLATMNSDERPAEGVAILRLRLAEQGSDGWRLVISRNIALPADRIAYFFLRNATPNPEEPNNPKLDYKLIYDRLAPPKAP